MSGDPAGGIAFTDIVGFTALTDLYGDDAAIDLLALQDALVRENLPEAGRIVKEIGDGLLLWFDDGLEAVDTLLTLQESFEKETENGRPLWVRFGLHWGQPRRRGDDIVGHDVNLASRIMNRAGPGEVLCSAAAANAAEEAAAADPSRPPVADFVPLGPVFVRGVKEPVALLRAIRPGPPVRVTSSGLVPHVL